jgi:hypothetical protein
VRRALAAAALALALAGCGSPAADLFKVDRSGAGAGAKLTLLVSDDGTVRCNGRPPVQVGAERLLEARQLARDLSKQAALGLELPPGPPGATTFRYRAELAEGTIAFSDSSRGMPPTFARLAAITRNISRDVCKLSR